MYKTQGCLARSNTLLIDQRQDRTPDRSRQRSPAHQPPRAVRVDNLSISHSAHVWIRAAAEIEHTTRSVAEITVRDEVAVTLEAQATTFLLKIGRHRISLITRPGKDIREATAARETLRGDFVQRLARRRRRSIAESVPLRTPNGEHVRTRAGEVNREDLARFAVADISADAGVARGHHDGGALERELHPFVALPLHVVVWPSVLAGPVGDGNDVCGLVDAALERACVAARVEVGIRWVEAFGGGAVAGLAVGAVGAVAAVDGIEEGLWVSILFTLAAGRECGGLLFQKPLKFPVDS